MAPELFSEDDSCGHSFMSDFWSLGCILYELAAGKPPFTSTSFTELMTLILQEPYPLLPEASSHFQSLLEGLLQKEPADRFTWKVQVPPPNSSG